MIKINGVEKIYVIDLNEPDYSEEILLKIDSQYTCIVSYVTDSNAIKAKIVKSNMLLINVDIESVKKDCYIAIQNIRREMIKILIKPNLEVLREKKYVFKLGKHYISGKTITFNVISKENGKEEPWSVEYDGEPMSYIIDKKKNKISFTLTSTIFSEIISKIILKQDKSDKTIEINLYHKDSNSVELYENEKS